MSQQEDYLHKELLVNMRKYQLGGRLKYLSDYLPDQYANVKPFNYDKDKSKLLDRLSNVLNKTK